MSPETAMRLALKQGRRASGRTFPNPAVGAVVFRGDRVLGRGCTTPPGGPHAEVVALARAAKLGTRAVRGATLAVTLEPCCHTGRTGPCTEAIVAAGLSRVLVGVRDSHPEVAGRGIARLRRSGVRVESGILRAACREHHRGFLSVQERGRPFVILKLATSLDGRIATASGDSRWISSRRAREWVHRLRSRTDAILVGSQTVLVDDPLLTARRGGRIVHRPVPVVVDSKLRTPPGARLLRRVGVPSAILFSGHRVPERRRKSLEQRGARVVPIRLRDGRVDLRAALEKLAELGPTTVVVEGGGELAAALLRARVVDELHWLVAPKLLGGDGRAALASLGVSRLADALCLEETTVGRLGSDIHVTARLPS